MAARTLTHWLRLAVALTSLVLSALVLASGILGPTPIRFGGTSHMYYQVVATPPPYYWLWGSLGLMFAAALFLWPTRSKGKK